MIFANFKRIHKLASTGREEVKTSRKSITVCAPLLFLHPSGNKTPNKCYDLNPEREFRRAY